jgi:RNase P/RNase MRP subunit p29
MKIAVRTGNQTKYDPLSTDLRLPPQHHFFTPFAGELMLTRLRFAAVLAIVLGLSVPTASWARQPKKYQVTGKVIEIDKDLIVVQKDEEKWEIAREAATKVEGELKVGAKVTVEYRMAATNVETKKDDGAKK